MSPDFLPLIAKVALFGALVAADETACGQFMISRPLVAGFVTGLLTGNLVLGCAFGAIFELLYIDVLPAGSSRFPSAGFAPVAAVSACASVGIGSLGEAGGTIPILFLFSALVAAGSGLLVVKERKANARLYAVAVRAAEEGDFARMQRMHLSGVLVSMARGVLTVLAVFCVVIPLRGFAEGLRHIPDQQFFIAPFVALGVAMVVRDFLSKKRLIHFAAGGLAALALLHLS